MLRRIAPGARSLRERLEGRRELERARAGRWRGRRGSAPTAPSSGRTADAAPTPSAQPRKGRPLDSRPAGATLNPEPRPRGGRCEPRLRAGGMREGLSPCGSGERGDPAGAERRSRPCSAGRAEPGLVREQRRQPFSTGSPGLAAGVGWARARLPACGPGRCAPCVRTERTWAQRKGAARPCRTSATALSPVQPVARDKKKPFFLRLPRGGCRSLSSVARRTARRSLREAGQDGRATRGLDRQAAPAAQMRERRPWRSARRRPRRPATTAT